MNDFENHPGFTASSCPARITVTPASNIMASCGYSCKITGGHCLPDVVKCSNLLEVFKLHRKKDLDELADLIDYDEDDYYHPQGQS